MSTTKQNLILLKEENKIYIRPVDIPKIKPLLKLANIELQVSEYGKHTGKARHYIPLDTGFPFLLSLLSADFEITFR